MTGESRHEGGSGICPECGAELEETGAVCRACVLSELFGGDGAEGGELATGPIAEASANYTLGDRIGGGGMGVVYRARDAATGRDVALKLLNAFGPDGGNNEARFQLEIEAVALLDHPHIVPIYDHGRLDGRRFYTMRLIEGGSLADRIASGGVGMRSAARTMATVATAVQHAHDRGILHRDLKPSNILIDENDAPHVVDFGLAKNVGSNSELTLSGAALGTPAYMAPEQAEGRNRELTTAADVYGLGAVLYHLLTGRPPYEGESPVEILRRASDSDPVAPSTLNTATDRDLSVICMRCLEREPGDRYTSAAAVSDDLNRWLNHEPILARPASVGERLRKWARRRPAVAALSALCLVGLFAFVIQVFFSREALKLERDRAQKNEREARALAKSEAEERRRAVALERAAESNLRRLYLERAETRFAVNDTGAGIAYLTATLRKAPDNRSVARRLLDALNRRNFPAQMAPAAAFHERVSTAHFDPSGTRLVTGSENGEVCVWSIGTGGLLTRFTVGEQRVAVARFSPDGNALAVGVGDDVGLWSTNGAPVGATRSNGGEVVKAEFSHDGRRLAVVALPRGMRLFDVREDGLKAPSVELPDIENFAFHPTADRILTAHWSGRFGFRDSDTGARNWHSQHGRGACASLFDASGKALLTWHPSGKSRVAMVWRSADGGQTGRLSQGGPIVDAAFHPRSALIATASLDGMVRISRNLDSLPYGILRHPAGVSAVRYSPDGTMLTTLTVMGKARLWSTNSNRVLLEAFEHSGEADSLEFSPDSRRLLSIGRDGRARLREVPDSLPGKLWGFRERREVGRVRFVEDGRSALALLTFSTGSISRLDSGRILETNTFYGGPFYAFDCRPERSRMLAVRHDGKVRIVAFGDGEPGFEYAFAGESGWAAAEFTPDGEGALLFDRKGVGRVMSAREPTRELTPVMDHGGPVAGARFLDTGGRIASWGGRRMRFWDAGSGAPLSEEIVAQGEIRSAAFDARGRRTLVATDSNEAFIHSIGEDADPLKLHHDGRILSVALSPDGRLAATGSSDRTARIWDTVTGKAMTPPLAHGSAVEGVFFGLASGILLTHCADGGARMWDMESGVLIGEPIWHQDRVATVDIDPRGGRFLSGSRGGSAHLSVVPPEFPGAVPEWFVDLAEALGGQTLGEDGLEELPAAKRDISPDWLEGARRTGGPLAQLAERIQR